MFSPASDSTPVVKAQTPTSSVERKWPSVDCAPSMAPSSLERPSPIASSIEPEMSITSSTDDGLRICVHWSIAAETTSTAGLGSVTAGPAGSTPYSAVNSSPSGTRLVQRPESVLGQDLLRGLRLQEGGEGRARRRACTSVTQSAPSTVTGLSDHIEPPDG